MISISNNRVQYHYTQGFVLVYKNVYQETRSAVLECSTLREALEIAMARGISLKDIVAGYPIGKLSTLYQKDLKALYSKDEKGRKFKRT